MNNLVSTKMNQVSPEIFAFLHSLANECNDCFREHSSVCATCPSYRANQILKATIKTLASEREHGPLKAKDIPCGGSTSNQSMILKRLIQSGLVEKANTIPPFIN